MFVIRRYGPGDQAAVWALHQLGLDQVGVHAGPGPWDDDFQDIAGVYLNAGGEFLVGLLGGRVVAMGVLRRTSETRAVVKRMRVHPDVQRRGFGQQILDALERRATTLGYGAVHLDTTAKQEAARALYLKNGYVEVGRKPWRDTEVILYEKRLPSWVRGTDAEAPMDKDESGVS